MLTYKKVQMCQAVSRQTIFNLDTLVRLGPRRYALQGRFFLAPIFGHSLGPNNLASNQNQLYAKEFLKLSKPLTSKNTRPLKVGLRKLLSGFEDYLKQIYKYFG